MKTRAFLKSFFREDLGLEKIWWHRLAKIFFIIFSILILIFSVFGFYFAEESSAHQYNIVKNFNSYLEESRNDCVAVKERLNSGEVVGRLQQFSCYVSVAPSFIEQDIFKNHSLGCLRENNRIEYLSDYSFKNDVICSSGPEYVCTIPESICDGVASNIVKYDDTIKYGISNYFHIILKVLGVLVFWLIFISLIYYKGLIYIVFGKAHG